MNELQVFKFNDVKVRTHLDGNGNPWFSALDVASILGIKNHRDAISKLLNTEKMSALLDGSREEVVVSEPGLYKLVFKSKKPEAQAFQSWVYNSVIPSIRKTGSYSSRPMSIADQIHLLAQGTSHVMASVDAVKNELVEVKKLAIEASSKNSSRTGFMTIRGYCNVHGIKLDLKASQKIGKACSSLARSLGAETRPTDDEIFGVVKSYPLGILEVVFSEENPDLAS